jgi:hypothetical protein
VLKVSLIAQGQQPVVIFDETKARPSDYCRDGFKPEPLRQFQNTSLARGGAPFLADRFNMYAKWDFTVTHTFATVQACQDFMGYRPAIIRAGELQILFQFSGASWLRYYKSAFLTVVKPIKTYPISADYSYTLLMPSLFSLTP